MDARQVTPEQRESGWDAYKDCAYVYGYVEDIIVPRLTDSPLRTDPFESALAMSFFRSHYYMSSLTQLSRPTDFQAVRSITRSLFEVYLDIKDLAQDPKLSERYHAYTALGRMRASIEIADYVAANPSPRLAIRYKNHIELANDAAQIAECEGWLKNLYGKSNVDIRRSGHRTIPVNWSDANNHDRAKRHGPVLLEYYKTEYAAASWFVHGGGTSVGGIDVVGLLNAWAYGMRMAVGLYRNSMYECCVHLKLVKDVKQLIEHLWARPDSICEKCGEEGRQIVRKDHGTHTTCSCACGHNWEVKNS